MEIKEVFDKSENGSLTYEQFEAAAKAANAKFTDLSEGKYVSVNKYNDDLAAKTKEVETLNGTITSRDKDLESLKQKLQEAGADATKLQEATDSLAALQTKYDDDTKAYKEQLKKQKYEFAVKEFVATQKFTSAAAKRDFESQLLAKELKMDKDKILGADDFVTSYKQDNADAFVTEPEGGDGGTGAGTGGAAGAGDNGDGTPHFIGSTPGGSDGNSGGQSPFNFSFTGVRPKPTE